ncbi:hypothetical protein ACFQ3N_14690 [Virgibacillus byunsanensis]|uniref:Uncharacterized protein n=1 Tax=Virgibacillus byunsanensis TaxID=570945 RepID=A0ABW3LQ89_9BACI
MYYLIYPGYFHSPYWHNTYTPYRQHQPVDPELLYESANESKKLMEDASKVLEKLSQSKEFDTKLMYAAQVSDTEEVERLIHSLGVTSEVNVNYNPDGLRLEFKSKVKEIDCCRLVVSLRWR